MISTMKKRVLIIACLVLAFLVLTGVNSSVASAEAGYSLNRANTKLVHGVYTEYFRKEGTDYTPVASQYEKKALDFECATDKEPYPGIDPNKGFRVIRTAYIKISGSGMYMFSPSSSGDTEIYVNDILLKPMYPYASLQDGQIIKVKVVSSFSNPAQSSLKKYTTNVYWKTPEFGLNYPAQRIQQEVLYTRPDLLGADVVVSDKLVHGVFTEYGKRQGTTNDFIPVASQYEDNTLDFSCQNNGQPYLGIDPAAGFQVKKTAYIKLTDTGDYRFYSNGTVTPKIYVNDVPVQNDSVSLEAGQVIKVTVEASFTAPTEVGRYFYDLYWLVPSDKVPYKSIPQELLYTSIDLNGVPYPNL